MPYEVKSRILVTGATGFCGSHLVKRLCQRGHEVTGLDIDANQRGEKLRSAGANLVLGSVADAALMNTLTEGHDIVYHLASPFRDLSAPDSVYMEVEVEGTRNVLEAARRHGVRRVVHCSTQGVHGNLVVSPGSEDSPIEPRDFYCLSKAEGEKVCLEYVDRGLDVTIVRPTSVYGPGEERWLGLFRAVQRGYFLMLGDGRTLNHPVYIDNLTDLFERVAVAPAARGRAYLAADEDWVTLNNFVRAIGHALGVNVRIIHLPLYQAAYVAATAMEWGFRPFGLEPPVYRRRLRWFTTNRAFRIDRARRELGYEPRVGLADGLARTVAWLRERGFLTATQSIADPRHAAVSP